MNRSKPDCSARTAEELGDFTTTLRVVPISVLAILIGAVCAVVALVLLRLIGLFGNLSHGGKGSDPLDDLLKARTRHLEEEQRRETTIQFGKYFPGGNSGGGTSPAVASGGNAR